MTIKTSAGLRSFTFLVMFVLCLLSTACAPAQVVEVMPLPVISISAGDQLPDLPTEVEVVYSDGKHGRLPVSWNVSAIEDKPILEDTDIHGAIAGRAEIAVIQPVQVIAPEYVIEWSGEPVDEKLRDRVRSLLFQSYLLTNAFQFGGFLAVNYDEWILLNGRQYFLVNDQRFPTYDDFVDLIEQVYAGEALDYALQNDLYILYDDKFYGMLDGASSVDLPSPVKRMRAIEMTDDTLKAEMSVTIHSVDGLDYEDVSFIEFVCIDGKWLIEKQGFQV